MPWIVYETTNLKNQKKYVGVHKQDGDEFDGYLGSGKVLNAAIQKYGCDNFERRTLFAFGSEDEAYAREAEIVTEEWCKREDTYNVKRGGFGGTTCYDPDLKAKQSAQMKAMRADPEFRAKQSARTKAMNADPDFRAKFSARMKALHADPEYKQKHSAAIKAGHARRRLEKANAMLVFVQDAHVSQTA